MTGQNRIDQLLKNRRDAIIERFIAELRRRDQPPEGLSRSALINALPRFLEDVAKQLRGDMAPDDATPAARAHGGQRWERGVDLEAVVREMGVLQRCVFQELDAAGATPSLREINALADCLNAGIAGAAAEHTRLHIEALQEERRRAELERDRSGSLLMQAPAPICVLAGPELIVQLANPLYCALVGHDDLVGKRLATAVLELDGQPSHAVLLDVLRTGRPFAGAEIPMRIARPAGVIEERTVNFLCQPTCDLAGDVEGVMVVAFDVTERIEARRSAERSAQALQQSILRRKEAEHALRVSEERFRKALRGSPVSVSTQDRDLRYTWIHNPYSKTEQDILGKTDAEVVDDPDDARPIESAKREVLATGVGQRREIAARVGDRTMHFDLSIEPLIDDRGDIVGVSCTATDITDRKLIEQALRASEARFRTVQEASPDGFMILRSVRDHAGTITDLEWVYLNPATDPILDGRGKELEGKRLRAEMPRSALAELFDAYARVVETGEPARAEILCLHEGVERGFRSIAVPLGDGVAISFHDITEQKRNEAERARLLAEEQRARQHAEELNRLKDEFLAIVSHELRTPLQAILGWTRVLRSGELDAAMADKGLDTIERNARAQAQLVEDILDASAIIAGKLRLRTDAVHVRNVLFAAIDTVRPAAVAKGVAIEADIAQDIGTIISDAHRLQQIVCNLLANAVKFTPREGRIRLRARRDVEMIDVSVQDNGEGIDPSFLPFVFERFRQADSGVNRAHGGLGLGLAIVRHLTEAQGGEVLASSDGPGKGATFRVRLPINAGQAPFSTRPAPGGAHGADPVRRLLEGVRILVVDDETDARELLGMIFKRAGAKVAEAASASEALEALREGHFDVLVSDVGMPGEDGYSLMRRLRAMGDGADPACGIPALALTAYARMEDRHRALAAGFQMHLAKPIEPSSLVAAVAHLAGRSGASWPWPP